MPFPAIIFAQVNIPVRGKISISLTYTLFPRQEVYACLPAYGVSVQTERKMSPCLSNATRETAAINQSKIPLLSISERVRKERGAFQVHGPWEMSRYEKPIRHRCPPPSSSRSPLFRQGECIHAQRFRVFETIHPSRLFAVLRFHFFLRRASSDDYTRTNPSRSVDPTSVYPGIDVEQTFWFKGCLWV